MAKSKMISFRLSNEAIASIRFLSQRFSNDARVQISMAKIVEIAVFNAENKTLAELLEFDR